MRTPLDVLIDVQAYLGDQLPHGLEEEIYEVLMLGVNGPGANVINRERFRQIKEEGYNFDHDDDFKFNELIDAATSYLLACDGYVKFAEAEENWPWDLKHFKPKDTWSNLVKAGALIAAELDRLHHQRVQEFIQRKIDADPDFFNQPGYPRNK